MSTEPSTEPSRMDRALGRLTRALARCGDELAREWALSAPGARLDWKSDPLPDEVRALLEWREDNALYLPTLAVDPWQQCAQQTRRLVPGNIHLSEGLRVNDGGVWSGEEPVSESLAELVELEAVLLERLPDSLARSVRLEGPPAPWQPVPEPTPEALRSCPVGTLLCCALDETSTLSVALKLGPRAWVLHYEDGSEPGALADVIAPMRSAAWSGELQVSPALWGDRFWRSQAKVWRREPMERLLARLDQAWSMRPAWLLEPMLPPASEAALQALERALGIALPEGLRQLWQHTAGTEGVPLGEDYALLSPSEVEEELRQLTCDEPEGPVRPGTFRPGFVPFLQGEGLLGCIDTKGQLAPAGSVVLWEWPSSAFTEVLHASLEDWLEACILQIERSGQQDDPQEIDEIVSPGHPFELDLDALQRVGATQAQGERPTPLERALSRIQADPQGRRLLDDAAEALLDFDAWEEQPGGPGELSVLRDWLSEQGASLGTGTLATLVARAAPLTADERS